ncbi:SDR family NAD(P)-dependent oxidoreductase [Isobaculum melis]|uniref:Short-chain dehydrogenase n=1 Tax=Isobaculum melis TaxID=142588 RepID=A0A1H9S2K5_9LACT|nr:SDR family oxidoreductase [Isobaculum melis]SER79227.1 hypothetical protein SAMN04488559_10663 [Isobaculum melis]
MEYVLITGASSGIGFELAKVFARNNYGLVLVSSNQDKLDLAANEIKKMSQVPIHSYAIDLSIIGQAKYLYEIIKNEALDISILINNAGYGLVGATEEIDFIQDEKMMVLNMISLVELTKYLIADMYRKNKGNILNISSTGAFQPGPYTSTYFASKSFVLSYTRAVRYEAKEKGVLVSTLCPGATRTNFFQREGMATPPLSMSAEKVAHYAYKKLLKGKEVIVPGLFNKAQRFVPVKLKMKIVASIKK